MMKSTTFKENPGSDRTREQVLDDVSRNRLFGFIDRAIEDAQDLSERKPFETHMREIRE